MKQYNLNKTVLVVDGMPDTIITMHVDWKSLIIDLCTATQRMISIPEGNWQILSIAKDMTEEKANVIMPKKGGFLFDHDHNQYHYYDDYTKLNHPFDSGRFDTALESFRSWMQSENIKDNDLILIKEKA